MKKNSAKVRRIIRYYDKQSDQEAAEEIERAPLVGGSVWITVPQRLLPDVHRSIASRKKSA